MKENSTTAEKTQGVETAKNNEKKYSFSWSNIWAFMENPELLIETERILTEIPVLTSTQALKMAEMNLKQQEIKEVK